MELRLLNKEGLTALYQSEMTGDFPRSELKPLAAMLRLMDLGRYDPLLVVQDGQTVGYAMLWLAGDRAGALLEYLGVLRGKRSGGLGTRILALLADRYGQLFGEAEAPGADASPAENGLRRRRIAFYERNGFRVLDYQCALFGVRFHCLYRGPEADDRKVEALHRGVYAEYFSPAHMERYIQLPLKPGEAVKPAPEWVEEAFPGGLQYRSLREEELSRALFGGFVRRQVVVQCGRRENGAWVVRDDPFVDDWSEEDYRVLTDCLGRTIKRGGFAYAAFLDGVLKGFASVEPEPMGPEGEYLDLSSIHVSEDVRGRGIGRELFQAAKGWAWAHGGKKLYISAHSAVETQAFYRAMGCVDAQFIHQGHAAAEPFDCQLECELSEIGACER